MKNISKILSIILLFALVGCDGPDTWCIGSSPDSYSDANTIKTVVDTNINVQSTSQNSAGDYGVWVDSGLFVNQGSVYDFNIGGSPGYEIVIASDFYSDVNEGLGQDYIISASQDTPTQILNSDGSAAQFAPNQQITITTADCTTGADSYGNSSPTKWTWNNNWKYKTVTCSYYGANDDDTGCDTIGIDCPRYPTNNDKDECVAVGNCQINCVDIPLIGNLCTTIYPVWYCYHQTYTEPSDDPPYMNNYYDTGSACTSNSSVSCSSSSCSTPCTYDLCPEEYVSGVDTPNYFICEGKTQDSYADTSPTYYSHSPTYDSSQGNAGYCDGKNQAGFGATSTSKSHPGCGNRSSDDNEQEQSTEVFNTTGSVDTCWNTGGLNLYAIQNDIQCPPSVDDRCFDLQGSYQTVAYVPPDSSGNQPPTAGKSFGSVGGPLWLQIINPNSNDTIANVDDYNTDIDTNNTTISQFQAYNTNSLYPQLTTSLTNMNGQYSNGTIESLRFQGYNMIEGVSDPTAQSYLTTLTNLLGTAYTDPSTQATVDGIQTPCLSLNNLITSANSGYDQSNSSTWEPVVVPFNFNSQNTSTWAPATYPKNPTDIYDIASSAMATATNLINYLDPPVPTTGGAAPTPPTLTGDTTSAELESYCQDVINTLTGMQQAFNAYSKSYAPKTETCDSCPNCSVAQTQSCIDANNAQISALTEQNNEYYADILNTNISNNANMVGGYKVYVAAGPLVADYGKYLQVMLVPNNQDPNSASTTGTEMIIDYSSGEEQGPNTITLPAMPFSGEIWTRIVDPDNNYTNNSGYYTLTFGYTTYTSGFSTMLSNIISVIQKTIQKTAQSIFLHMTCSATGMDQSVDGQCSDYIRSIDALLYMYVIIYGMMYLFGLMKNDRVDFIMRIVKVAVVSTLLTPNSFWFFNTYLFEGFYGLSNSLISYAVGAPVTNPFDFITQSVNVLLLDQTTYFKIIGLMLQGLLGLVAFALLINGILTFAGAIFKAFIMYMTSFVGIGLCLSVAPIFIIFLLFEKTSYLFSNWFKAMVKFTITPVILLIGLVFINGMLFTILVGLFNYQICYKCTMPFTFAIPGFPSVGTVTLFCVSWFSKWGADNVGSAFSVVLTTFPLVINFCIITKTMKLYSDRLAAQVAEQIVGSSSLFSPSSKYANASMGANPISDMQKGFKKIDRTMERAAITTGIAKNGDEYKGMRNRTLRTGFKYGAALSAGGIVGVGAVGAYSYMTKTIPPKSLTEEEIKNKAASIDSAQQRKESADNLRSQKENVSNKYDSYAERINSGSNTKTQNKKLIKGANREAIKLNKLDTKIKAITLGMSADETKALKTRESLKIKADQAAAHYNNFVKKHGKNDPDKKGLHLKKRAEESKAKIKEFDEESKKSGIDIVKKYNLKNKKKGSMLREAGGWALEIASGIALSGLVK